LLCEILALARAEPMEEAEWPGVSENIARLIAPGICDLPQIAGLCRIRDCSGDLLRLLRVDMIPDALNQRGLRLGTQAKEFVGYRVAGSRARRWAHVAPSEAPHRIAVSVQ